MKSAQRFVLDTSAFTGISKSKQDIDKHISEMIRLISKAKKANITCYTSPSVWQEIINLFGCKNVSDKQVCMLDAWLVKRSPSRMEILMPSEFLYQYILEVRDRFNKGLREAEKAVLAVGGNRPDPEVVKDLREHYKTAVRQGLLDSVEDLDIILLAKELEACVVAKDAGIKDWAGKWGLSYIDGERFPTVLKEYLGKGK